MCVLGALGLGATTGSVDARELEPSPAELLTKDASADVVPTRVAEGWIQELTEIRQMVEFLVRRERKLDVKTDVAVRRLERLEEESDQLQRRRTWG